MRIRIRLGRGPVFSQHSAKNQHLAQAVGALLSPAAAVSLALAAWRLGSDIGITGEFVIAEGILSHWQVWVALAALLQFASSFLTRYARRGKTTLIHTLAAPREVRSAEPPARMSM
ncbi:MAG: hypothetical protein NZV14_08035 [Bryobacteraceae bacterium]|nr:hypothetical protein [Bryobacteraceae bacterium]MDW8378096.1 hypothetical protein [Bryobacterales bacterium]